MRVIGHGLVVLALTVLTQLGGLAWLIALRFRRRLVAFVLAYAAIWGAAQVGAPLLGRVPLPCGGEALRMQSPLYCAMLRNFVTPDLLAVAQEAAARVAADHPGTVTLALDGSFPFLDGMPLVPHLSHDDGEKLDFAFYYRDAAGYLAGQTASWLGYFAFERGAETCPPAWATLRWDMAWFQPLVRDLELEPDRTAALIRALAADPRVAKVFVEPPLAARLGVQGDKLRFQGCRAARHDDHIHIQL
jgi:murein endopeptidase